MFLQQQIGAYCRDTNVPGPHHCSFSKSCTFSDVLRLASWSMNQVCGISFAAFFFLPVVLTKLRFCSPVCCAACLIVGCQLFSHVVQMQSSLILPSQISEDRNALNPQEEYTSFFASNLHVSDWTKGNLVETCLDLIAKDWDRGSVVLKGSLDSFLAKISLFYYLLMGLSVNINFRLFYCLHWNVNGTPV